jgi:hypothetical protein
MRFVVEAKPTNGGWEVTVQGIAQPDGPRRMQRVGEFPQRLEAQSGKNVAKTDLWDQTDPEQIRNAFGRIASGTPANREVALFGHYLFLALLGEDLWHAIRDEAKATGDDLIELALSFEEDDTDLHRLPWETLHSGTSFLTAEAQRLVAITRLVPSGKAQEATRVVEARVLFVVGAALNDPELRPGAEYLGLLRRLEASGLGLSSHLLLQATVESLRDAVLEIRPSIVHIIAHGAFSNGRAVLKLTDKETRKPTREVTSEQLANLLCEPVPGDATWQGPAIVVLNACYSGQAFGGLGGALPKDRNIPALAAELVYRGIPLVVGMGGRVADRACRIFTRRFYATLLLGDPVRGIAQGRRAGHGEGTSPEDTIDWALPVLFIDPAVTVTVDKDARFPTILQGAFQGFVGPMNHKPTAFCGRLSCMADLQELVSGESAVPNRVRRVMVVYDNLSSGYSTQRPKFGRTWLLDQLTLQAVLGGHIPCLVKLEENDDPPRTLLKLAEAIRFSAETTCEHFGLQPPPSEVAKLRYLTAGGSIDSLAKELKQVVQLEGADSTASVRLALRLDLLRLRDVGRQWLGYPGAQVLVLIDNLHRADAIAEEVVSDRFLRADGFGVKGAPIPVVYSFWKESSVRPSAYDALMKHAAKNYVIKHQVTAFDSPTMDRMPYEQYLLQLEPPWVPVPSADKQNEVVSALHFIYNRVMKQGVPSNLEGQADVIMDFLKLFPDRFQSADDEDWLKKEGFKP